MSIFKTIINLNIRLKCEKQILTAVLVSYFEEKILHSPLFENANFAPFTTCHWNKKSLFGEISSYTTAVSEPQNIYLTEV